jgi:hypothetical protein
MTIRFPTLRPAVPLWESHEQLDRLAQQRPDRDGRPCLPGSAVPLCPPHRLQRAFPQASRPSLARGVAGAAKTRSPSTKGVPWCARRYGALYSAGVTRRPVPRLRPLSPG